MTNEISAAMLAGNGMSDARARGGTMELSAIAVDDLGQRSRETRRLHGWRVEQLRNLGLPFVLAEMLADRLDWHALAALIERGCPLYLALEIVL
jgi:hypothetical protein